MEPNPAVQVAQPPIRYVPDEYKQLLPSPSPSPPQPEMAAEGLYTLHGASVDEDFSPALLDKIDKMPHVEHHDPNKIETTILCYKNNRTRARGPCCAFSVDDIKRIGRIHHLDGDERTVANLHRKALVMMEGRVDVVSVVQDAQLWLSDHLTRVGYTGQPPQVLDLAGTIAHLNAELDESIAAISHADEVQITAEDIRCTHIKAFLQGTYDESYEPWDSLKGTRFCVVVQAHDLATTFCKNIVTEITQYLTAIKDASIELAIVDNDDMTDAFKDAMKDEAIIISQQHYFVELNAIIKQYDFTLILSNASISIPSTSNKYVYLNYHLIPNSKCHSFGMTHASLGLVATTFTPGDNQQVASKLSKYASSASSAPRSFIFNIVARNLQFVLFHEISIILNTPALAKSEFAIVCDVSELIDQIDIVNYVISTFSSQCISCVPEQAAATNTAYKCVFRTNIIFIELIEESFDRETTLLHINTSYKLCGCSSDQDIVDVVSANKIPLYIPCATMSPIFIDFINFLNERPHTWNRAKLGLANILAALSMSADMGITVKNTPLVFSESYSAPRPAAMYFIQYIAYMKQRQAPINVTRIKEKFIQSILANVIDNDFILQCRHVPPMYSPDQLTEYFTFNKMDFDAINWDALEDNELSKLLDHSLISVRNGCMYMKGTYCTSNCCFRYECAYSFVSESIVMVDHFKVAIEVKPPNSNLSPTQADRVEFDTFIMMRILHLIKPFAQYIVIPVKHAALGGTLPLVPNATQHLDDTKFNAYFVKSSIIDISRGGFTIDGRLNISYIRCAHVAHFAMFLRQYHPDVLSIIRRNYPMVYYISEVTEGFGDASVMFKINALVKKYIGVNMHMMICSTDLTNGQRAFIRNNDVDHMVTYGSPCRMQSDEILNTFTRVYMLNRPDIIILGPAYSCRHGQAKFASAFKHEYPNAKVVLFSEAGTMPSNEESCDMCYSWGFSSFDLGIFIEDFTMIEPYQHDPDCHYVFNYIAYNCEVVLLQELMIIAQSTVFSDKRQVHLQFRFSQFDVGTIKTYILKHPQLRQNVKVTSHTSDQLIVETTNGIKVMIDNIKTTMNHDEVLRRIKASHFMCGCTGDASFMEVLSAKKFPVYEALPHKYDFYRSFLLFMRSLDTSGYQFAIGTMVDHLFNVFYQQFTHAEGAPNTQVNISPDFIRAVTNPDNILQQIYKHNILEKYVNANVIVPYYLASLFVTEFDAEFVKVWKQQMMGAYMRHHVLPLCKAPEKLFSYRNPKQESCAIL